MTPGRIYDRAREIEAEPRPLRAAGHRLRMQWSGEHGAESSSTGTCACGWEESASSQKVVRGEYRHHIAVTLARAEAGAAS